MPESFKESVSGWMDKARNVLLAMALAVCSFLAGAVWNNSIRIAAMETRVARNAADIENFSASRYNTQDADRDLQSMQRQFDQLVSRLERMERKIDQLSQ